MHEPIVERVLLTNDDGIEAPGLKLLERIAKTIAQEVWIVAPEQEQSGASHRLSVHVPLRVSAKQTRKFSVCGTPADCVVIAVNELMKEKRPDLILSGINSGENLGNDTVFSGTVGAAMVGLLMGIRSISLSQVSAHSNPARWETAAAMAPQVLHQLANMSWPPDCCFNVNFPDVPPSNELPILFTEQGPGVIKAFDVARQSEVNEDAYYSLRIRRGHKWNPPAAEAAAVLKGTVSITPLHLERTDMDALSTLRSRGVPVAKTP